MFPLLLSAWFMLALQQLRSVVGQDPMSHGVFFVFSVSRCSHLIEAQAEQDVLSIHVGELVGRYCCSLALAHIVVPPV